MPSLSPGYSAQTRKSGTQRGYGEGSGGRGRGGEFMVFPCGRESMILSSASPTESHSLHPAGHCSTTAVALIMGSPAFWVLVLAVLQNLGLVTCPL